jgi:hypothetical protein
VANFSAGFFLSTWPSLPGLGYDRGRFGHVPGHVMTEPDPQRLPEETGVEGSQAPGDASLSSFRIPDGARGLSPGTLEDVSEYLSVRAGQGSPLLRGLLRGFDQALLSTQLRSDRLQDELLHEKVDHARRDEQRMQGIRENGLQRFVTALGGGLLGYGGSVIESGASAGRGIASCVLGLVLIGASSWPLIGPSLGRIRSSWNRRHG